MPCNSFALLLLLLLLPTCLPLPLNVVVVLAPSFVERTVLPTGAAVYSGLAIDVFERALATICDRTAPCYRREEVTYSEAPVYGLLNPSTGVWTGAIGELVAGRADVAVGEISVNLARTAAVNFTSAWLDAPLGFLVPRVLKARTTDLWSWLRPFSANLWLALLGCTAVFALSLAWLDKLSPFSTRNLPPLQGREADRQLMGQREAWHRSITNLLGQGPWGMDLSAHSSRLIFWAMAFLSLFTTTFYTSSLTAQLNIALAPSTSTQVSSLGDIQVRRYSSAH